MSENQKYQDKIEEEQAKIKKEKLLSIDSQISIINDSLFTMENSKAIGEEKCNANMKYSVFLIFIFLIGIAFSIYFFSKNVSDSFKMMASIVSFTIVVISILWAFIYDEKFDWLGVKKRLEKFYREKAYRYMSYYPEKYEELINKKNELINEKAKLL